MWLAVAIAHLKWLDLQNSSRISPSFTGTEPSIKRLSAIAHRHGTWLLTIRIGHKSHILNRLFLE
ncbi:MAG: hypothetical protein AAGA75_09340 [Cyanobacteria bacterium P01_E01_bin.6]